MTEAAATGWESDLGKWLQPFLDALGHKVRQRWAPVYVRGLLGPGERKSVQPMAARHQGPSRGTVCGHPRAGR